MRKRVGKLLGNLTTFVFIVALVGLYTTVFGKENTLIGVAAVAGILMYRQIDLGISLKEACCLLIGGCVAMGLVVEISKWLVAPAGAVCHIVAVFLLVLTTAEHFEFKTYMPFLLGYIFLQGNPVVGKEAFFLRMGCLLFTGILMAFVYFMAHRKREIEGRTLKEIVTQLDFGKDSVAYCVKLSVGLGIAMLLTDVFHLQKGMWISITVMSLTQVEYAVTKWRTKSRIFGTVIGFVLFLLLFRVLIPPQYAGIAAMVMGYLYTFISKYVVQIMFITVSSLSVAQSLFALSVSMPMRLGFIIIGVFIVFGIQYMKLPEGLSRCVPEKVC